MRIHIRYKPGSPGWVSIWFELVEKRNFYERKLG